MEIGKARTEMRTSYYYDVTCSACRTTTTKGNRLEATVDLINHAKERHNDCDWHNLLDTTIITMYWNSKEAGHSALTTKEVLEFMGLMAVDQDIPYEDYTRFSKNIERNGA